MTGDGTSPEQLVQLRPDVVIRRAPADEPAEDQGYIPAHQRDLVHRALVADIGRELKEPGLHPAYHHADVKTLENRPEGFA